MIEVFRGNCPFVAGLLNEKKSKMQMAAETRERVIADAPGRLLADAVLIERAMQGDEPAFRDLVWHYQGMVFACAQAITRNPADAEDAAQEAFIRFHRNMTQFDPRRPLKPYLLRIAANCSRTLVSRRVRVARREEAAGRERRAVPDARGERLAEERFERLRTHVAALPGTLREVTSLFYFAECSCREVAHVLAMTENAVKVALHRARKRLQAEMTSLEAMP